MFEERAKEYAVSRTYPRFEDDFTANFVLREVEGAFWNGAKEALRWHKTEEEPLPMESQWETEYAVRLWNGNKRIIYWDIHTYKDVVSGEHIPPEAVKLWIKLPPEE